MFMDCLDISDKNLTFLHYIPSNTTVLKCFDNKLTQLPALPEGLTHLYCAYNRLTTLPDLPKTLRVLFCSDNQLIALPALPNSLVELHCCRNQLQELPRLPKTIRVLYSCENQLSYLPNRTPQLVDLMCWKNAWNENFQSIMLSDNPIEALTRYFANLEETKQIIRNMIVSNYALRFLCEDLKPIVVSNFSGKRAPIGIQVEHLKQISWKHTQTTKAVPGNSIDS